MQQRREHVRRLLQVEASIADEAGLRSWHVQVIDISRMGVAFVSTEQLATDVSYVFSFCFPGSAARNDVVTTIVHSTPVGSEGRFRNGARFIHIAEECVERIVDYVTSDGSKRDSLT